MLKGLIGPARGDRLREEGILQVPIEVGVPQNGAEERLAGGGRGEEEESEEENGR